MPLSPGVGGASGAALQLVPPPASCAALAMAPAGATAAIDNDDMRDSQVAALKRAYCVAVNEARLFMRWQPAWRDFLPAVLVA